MNLSILEKTYELIIWAYPMVNKFPKSQRFVLGQHIENSLIKILEKIIETNLNKEKLKHLKEISIEIDKLRYLIRLSKDLKFISINKYGIACDKINEIGKMLGGWIKFNLKGDCNFRKENKERKIDFIN